MKPGARSLYQRVQSSDDSEDSSPPQEKNPGATPDPPNPSPPNGSSSEDDPKIEDDLKALTASQAHQTSSALDRAKKTVMIEIKGKSPPGKDGVFALNRDMKCQPPIENIPPSDAESKPDHHDFHERKYDYKPGLIDYGSTMISNTHAGSMLSKERLIDTRKVFPATLQATNTLDRVKRLQERAGMMDVKDRIHDRILERRDRSNAALNQCRSYNNNVHRLRGPGFESVSSEKPMLDADSKHEGALKISDRSFCENGCEALLRVIKNNDKLVELDLSGCHWNGTVWDWHAQG
ncbi:hypothetical protein M758_5G151200 [Ceratodon purpureus]|nr:hypothetical protein M758_5G151200 [Ceratodon purpureus]